MRRAVFAALMFALALASWAGQVLAEKRLALVIGINAYKDVPALDKAVGDAKAMSEKLSGLGFAVSTVLDADRRSLNKALTQFYGTIELGDTVLVHYSGHGVQIGGENYLLPADIPEPESGQTDLLKAESLPLSSLVDTLGEKGAAVRILIIDACRDNPFASKGKRSLGSTRGLGTVEPAKGSFVMFSAGAGQAALDRLGDSDTSPTSVYMRVLLSRLSQPDMKLRDIAASVKEDVDKLAKSVGHEQRPAYYDELPEDFTITGRSIAVTPKVETQTVVVEPVPVPTPEPQPQTPAAIPEDQAYQLAQGIGTPEAWDAFISQYPNGAYVAFARAAKAKVLADLKPKPEPKPIPTPKPKPKPQQQAALEEEPPPPPKPRNDCSRIGTVHGLIPDSGDGFLSVRSGPGVNFQEMTRIFNDDRVAVCGFGNGGRWVKIRYGGGRIGWVSRKYLAVGG